MREKSTGLLGTDFQVFLIHVIFLTDTKRMINIFGCPLILMAGQKHDFCSLP
jgi:hypothetical protein